MRGKGFDSYALSGDNNNRKKSVGYTMVWRNIFILSLIIIVLFVVLFVKSELDLDVQKLRFSMPKWEKYDQLRHETGEEFERIWNKEHPDNQIDIVYEPLGGGGEQINTQVVAGTLPDIFYATFSFHKYIQNDILLDLTPYIEKYDDWDYIEEIYPQLTEYLTVDDKIYGVPGNLNTAALFYNKALFGREGVPYPDKTSTWADMRDAAIKLTKRDAEGRALQFGLLWEYHPFDATLMNVGKIINDQGRCIIYNERAIEAAKFADNLINKDHVTPSPSEREMGSSMEVFKNNRAAMMYATYWNSAELKRRGDLDWGVSSAPVSFGGKAISMLKFDVMSINAKTRYPEIAYKFLLFLASREQIHRMVELGDSMPIRHGREANEFFLNDPTRPKGENQAFIDVIKDAYTYKDAYPVFGPMKEVGDLSDKYRDRFFIGNITAEKMLKDLQKEYNALVDKYEKQIERPAILSFVLNLLLIIGAPITIAAFFWRHFRKKSSDRGLGHLVGATGASGSFRRGYSGYLFLMPNFVGFLIFVSVPVLSSLVLSFCKWDLLSWPPKFVGFANFIDLLGDVENFWQLIFNTAFLMSAIPIGIIGALLLAMILNQKIRGRNIYRAVFFLPSFTAGVAVFILWKWMFNAEFGLINIVIAKLGHIFGAKWTGPNWLRGEPFLVFLEHFKIGFAKPAIVLMTLWAAVGGANMILYLAGLQGINPELYEAADIDGASKRQKFWNITWPLLSPTTFFILIMSVIGGFQGGFGAAFNMTRGGPDLATTTISYGIYTHAYRYYQMGKAAAISWILFLLVFVFTLINWRFGGKRVHYQ